MKKDGANNRFWIAVCCLLVVAIVAAAVAWFNRDDATNRTFEKLVSDKSLSQTENQSGTPKPIINIKIVEDSLRQMGFLVTQEYCFTATEEFSDSKYFFESDIEIPFTKKSFTAQYSGVVQAGINFEEITVEQEKNSDKIIIYLPKTQLQEPNIDENSFKSFDEKNGFANKLTLKDGTDARIKLVEKAKNEAIEKGTLTQASKNAEAVVKCFLKSIAGGSINYEIISK